MVMFLLWLLLNSVELYRGTYRFDDLESYAILIALLFAYIFYRQRGDGVG